MFERMVEPLRYRKLQLHSMGSCQRKAHVRFICLVTISVVCLPAGVLSSNDDAAPPIERFCFSNFLGHQIITEACLGLLLDVDSDILLGADAGLQLLQTYVQPMRMPPLEPGAGTEAGSTGTAMLLSGTPGGFQLSRPSWINAPEGLLDVAGAPAVVGSQDAEAPLGADGLLRIRSLQAAIPPVSPVSDSAVGGGLSQGVASMAAAGGQESRGAGALPPLPQGASGGPAAPSPFRPTSSFEDERSQLSQETQQLQVLSENSRLRRQNEELAAEARALREEAAERQREDAVLRQEEASLRETLAFVRNGNATALPSAGFTPILQRQTALRTISRRYAEKASSLPQRSLIMHRNIFHNRPLFAMESVILVLFVVSVFCATVDCAFLRRREVERNDADEMALLHFAGDRGDISFCSLLCHRNILCFLWLTLLSALFMFLVLWQSGELKRIMTQISVQAYCSIVLACFYSVLIGLLLELVRRLVRFLVKESRKMKDLNPLRRARMGAMV
jgi:hypothetical protein